MMTKNEKVIDHVLTGAFFGGMAVWGLAGSLGWRGAVGIVALVIYAWALIRHRNS